MAGLAQAQVEVTTYHYDVSRTGANTSETILNTTNVKNNFGKLFSLPVDAEIYAQPLYMPNVTVPGQGVHNVVYVATMNNSVYAFDADTGGNPLWKVNFGTPMPDSVCCVDRDILVQIGILSTPVIDPNAGVMYLVAETYENGVTAFTLHAISITTGADVETPVVIKGSVAGTASDGTGKVLPFTAFDQWQRTGLLLANGQIYIAFGSHQDTEPYHGWLFSYNATTLAQTGIFCVTPNGPEGGIWQGGVGMAADTNGYVYVETGNGLFDVNTGGIDYGDSVLKLSGNGLTVADYFTPSTQANDDTEDWDLGSAGALLIPGTTLVAAGGKDGKFYIANTANMGKYNATTDQIFQEWQATYAYAGNIGGFWAGNYLFFNNAMYAFGERDYLKVWPFNGTKFVETPSSESTFIVPAGFANDPAMTISSNGTQAGTGIVWAAFSSDGIADGSVQPGVFYAFDASNVANVLWNSNANSARDSSGNWAKWDPPIVANGKVYLASFDDRVNVYGLLSSSTGNPGTGSLTGSSSTATTAASLTAAGSADWIHWGDTAVNRKAGVSAQLSSYTAAGAVHTYNNDPRALTWTDGTPTATDAADTNGLYVGGVGNGFSFTAPADTTTRTLTVYVGGWNSGGTLTATLSDGSAANFVATTATVNGQYDATYTLTYAAGSAGQTLTVSWAMSSGTGNVNLCGAALAVSGDGIAASAGTPQTTVESTSFAAPLQATVTSAAGAAVSGVTVTFTAPSTGASATFGGAATATAVTNGNGVAISPTPTANATAGSYSVTASVSGVAAVASYSLTNTAPVVSVPASITTTAGTPQATTVGTAFATNLAVSVLDVNGNPVSGANVTFTAPATGASATFAGAATATVATDANGVATAPTLTANATIGAYLVTAGVSGLATDATFTLTNDASTGGGTGSGSLTGAQSASTATANLTTVGTSDWIHWGDAALNRKAGVTAQLSTYTAVGTAHTYNNDLRGLGWTDGNPTATETADTNGLYVSGVKNGFKLTAPAGTTTQTLTVYVGGWNSGGTLTATLSDGSAANFVATTATANGQYDETFTLTYAAASAGQTLTVSWIMSSGTGNVTLNGAALSGSPSTAASITATAGTPQTATVDTAFATALQVTVLTSGGTPQSGASVTFTAPATGASASFAGAATATVTTDANGIATAPTLTADATAGSYSVTAAVAGVATPATFTLTNAAATGGAASLTGSETASSATVNLTTEGVLDWVHWGDTALTRKAGVTAAISTDTKVGAGGVNKYTNDPRKITWTDGTPTASSANDTNGLYTSGDGNGFSLTAPASTTTQVLTVHVGGWNSGGTLTAVLADGSAAAYTNTTATANGQYDVTYTLTYTAGSTTTLTVSWVMSSGTGNVTLSGAALSN